MVYEYGENMVREKTRGWPKTTYLQLIQTQLKEKQIQTLDDAMIEAKDRERRRANDYDLWIEVSSRMVIMADWLMLN